MLPALLLRGLLVFGKGCAMAKRWPPGIVASKVRGGMYALERKAFDRQITALLEGEEYDLPKPRKGRGATALACPACPRH